MLGVLILLASPIAGAAPPQAADFVAYVEEVRRAGMTEDARGNLNMVAGILVGETVVEFPRDPASGGYGRAYRSTSCPAPGLSAEARAKLAGEPAARREPVVKRLREAPRLRGSGQGDRRDATPAHRGDRRVLGGPQEHFGEGVRRASHGCSRRSRTDA